MSLSFTCPRCRALLKIRDESFIGINLDCPECQAPLHIVKSESGEVIGQEVSPATSSPAISKTGKRASATAVSKTGQSPAAVSGKTGRGPQTPQILAWVVAGLCLLALIPFLVPSRKPVPVVPDTTGRDVPPQQNGPDKPAKIAKVEPGKTPDNQPEPLPDSPEGRLKELGKLVLKQAETDGHFPAGTISSPELNAKQRWSWQARIAVRTDNPGSIIIPWNQRWNDPAYDRFVRRSIPRFQNPQAKSAVSEDRYPATHFVGVAGVGADAATLPADHPRAGIFGQDRQTKPDQIRDGLSNTMLLAGVEEHLGSWAEGTASYRAFTREPYIHGPDGFGTGQPDRMFVLMADGSVRLLNQKTDPRITRRMAAMNDGLALDIAVPGEPGDPPPGKTPMPDPVVAKAPPVNQHAAKGDPPNAQAEPAQPEVKPIDIPAALSRKILKFDQARPAAAFKLILQIEELAGVRIEYDRQQLGDAAKRLDKQITLRKENASLEELLDDVLQQIDLQRKSEPTCIRIVAAEST